MLLQILGTDQIFQGGKERDSSTPLKDHHFPQHVQKGWAEDRWVETEWFGLDQDWNDGMPILLKMYHVNVAEVSNGNLAPPDFT